MLWGSKMKKALVAIWKFVHSPYLISLCALLVSAYTFWDANFNFKLDIAAGRQVKLTVAKIDKRYASPAILLSLALTNSGGKTSYIDDVKLIVTLVSNNKELWQEEFVAMREYDTLLGDGSTIKQTEIMPVVIVGKTTEVKKYVFAPPRNVKPENIPRSFDLNVGIYTKRGAEWRLGKQYEIKNLSDIWQDWDNQDAWRHKITDMFEKI